MGSGIVLCCETVLRGGAGNGGGFRGGKGGEREFAPFDGGAELGDAERQGEHPVGKSGIAGVIGAGEEFQLLQRGKDAPVILLEPANVLDGNAGAGIASEEKLEKEFIAGGIVAVGDGEPLLQTVVAGRSDLVLLPVCAGGRAGIRRDDELFGGQAFEGGIDLAKALAPEEADALLDGFANLVSGLVGVDGEDSENDVGSLALAHIARRYIY